MLSRNCAILSTNKGGQINFSLIKVIDLIKHKFLVPDSYRATERNGSSISADVTDESNENY